MAELDYKEMDALFHPTSIAFVGASPDFLGSLYMSAMLEPGFQGKVYPVNIHGGEMLGLKTYTSLADIPGSVDYAFVQVPAQASIQVVKDCAAKGVKFAVIFTAGFGESENEKDTRWSRNCCV